MQTAKQQARELIDQLPDNATWDEIAYRVEVHASIERGRPTATRVASHLRKRSRSASASRADACRLDDRGDRSLDDIEAHITQDSPTNAKEMIARLL
ncbi:MAG: hypothetical protein MZW92_27140 [Comamonadaceae bacterium]|nr:hypothetical protein [Comamonadaceae bacterium]